MYLYLKGFSDIMTFGHSYIGFCEPSDIILAFFLGGVQYHCAAISLAVPIYLAAGEYNQKRALV